MKRLIVFLGVCASMVGLSQISAQTVQSPDRSTLNHAEIGVFADYLRFEPVSPSTNFVGVGARAGFNLNPFMAIEGEMSYDFARNFTTTYKNGVNTSYVVTSVRPLTGLFGPKIQFGTSGPLRVFATGKIGFINFSTNNSGVISGGTFTSAVSGVGDAGTHLAFYPGGGIEFFAGPFGLRAEVGDEIYFNNGMYNNLRVQAGPVLRF